MNNELKIIKEQEVLGKQFRIYGTIENPFFLAKDVAEWIEHSNSTMMLQSVDIEEKTVLKTPTKDCLVGMQPNTEYMFLTENGLYEVLFQSRKPIAKKFKKEVKVILKQLRLTGGVVVENREAEFITNYFPSFSEEVKLAMIQDLRGQNKQYKTQIEEQKPLVDFANKVSNTSDLIDMGRMAKLLKDEQINIGRNRLFNWLRNKEILMKNNTPYQKYIDSGYFKVKESMNETAYGVKVFVTTYITGKGQIYITEKLRNEFGKLHTS